MSLPSSAGAFLINGFSHTVESALNLIATQLFVLVRPLNRKLRSKVRRQLCVAIQGTLKCQGDRRAIGDLGGPGQLDTHPEAALEMWKAACSWVGNGKVPTFDQTINVQAGSYFLSDDLQRKTASLDLTQLRRVCDVQQLQGRCSAQDDKSASVAGRAASRSS